MEIDILQFKAIYDEGWKSCHEKYTKDLIEFIKYGDKCSDREFRKTMRNLVNEGLSGGRILICGYTKEEGDKYFKFCKEYYNGN